MRLTKRHRQVLCWIYYGKGNKEIASILKISDLTVKTHVQRLLLKFGVENRTRLVTRALEEGELTLRPVEGVKPDAEKQHG